MNEVVRKEIYKNGLKHWQVADALGINEATLSRKLRHELPDDEQDRILKAIEEIGGKHDN